MKFVCDNTVGKLARSLRMAGLDTAYVAEDDLYAVVALSKEQGRRIVSRNSRYCELTIADNFYHLTVDDPDEQFILLVLDLDLSLDADNFLTRCADCNESLIAIDRSEVKGRVWPYVWQTQKEFSVCPNCDKVYWSATHAKAITRHLQHLMDEIARRRGEDDL